MFVKLFSLLFKTLFVCLLSLVHLLISSKFSFLLSLYSNDMAPKSRNLKIFSAFFPSSLEKKVRYLRHLLRYLRNSYRFGIRFQIGFVWAPPNDRSLNISYPDIFTHSIFKRNFWFCKIHLKKPLTFPIINSISLIYFLTLLLYIDT